MTDYPDWSRLIQVVGSDIMIPIDIQGAYIMMPVDIQGQYVDLDVAITAENIASIMLALTAETMDNIKIDINTQTIDDLNINIDAQNIGVYLQPDWQTLQGTDKNVTGNVLCPAGTPITVLSYQVTAGKTFYICQWGFSVYENTGCWASLHYSHLGTPTRIALSGGAVGNSHSLPKPVAVVAGDLIEIVDVQWSDIQIMGFGFIGGYEV